MQGGRLDAGERWQTREGAMLLRFSTWLGVIPWKDGIAARSGCIWAVDRGR